MLQVSFVPGVSFSDSNSTSNFSFNILGGYNGAFYGFEMGTLLNINRYDVSGVQLSGVANINQQHASRSLLGQQPDALVVGMVPGDRAFLNPWTWRSVPTHSEMSWTVSGLTKFNYA